MGRRARNRHAIELFIVFQDRLFPSSVGFLNLEEMQGEPESTPPMPDHALDYIEDEENRRTALYLTEPLKEMRREAPPLHLIACLVAGWVKPMQDEEVDHAALIRWRAKETEQDKARADLFERAITWLETRLNDKYPHVQISVNVPREDEPVKSKRDAQKKDTAYSDSVIVGWLATIEREEGPMTRKAAMGLLSDRKVLSIPRVRKAIENENRRARESA